MDYVLYGAFILCFIFLVSYPLTTKLFYTKYEGLTGTNTTEPINNPGLFQQYTVNKYHWNWLKNKINEYQDHYAKLQSMLPINWSVGTISTLSSDQPPQISVSGNMPNLQLNFSVPNPKPGLKGPPGSLGEMGSTGENGQTGAKGLPGYSGPCAKIYTMVNSAPGK